MLNEETQMINNPLINLKDLMWGYRVSRAMYVVTKLGIPDLLASGPKSVQEIADVTGAHPDALLRLLRALTTKNVMHEEDNGCFSITELGAYLQTDHPQSNRSMLLMQGSPTAWEAWGHLEDAVMTGNSAFELLHDESHFDFMEKHPDELSLFQAAMTNHTAEMTLPLINVYDFSGFQQLIDVGGGQGTFLCGILQHYPHLKGILFDLPSVVNQAKSIVRQDLQGRFETVGGDMLQSIPKGADGVIMKRVLHDWDNANARRILQNCRQAITEQGRLMVIESVLKPSNQPDPGKWKDLNMLVMQKGLERTEADFQALFQSAGFHLTRIIPIPADEICMIEGVPG